MKLLIISDIHSNFYALNLLLNKIKNIDKIICLGDITGYYCQVNETIELLRKNNVFCILGNHDYYLINGYTKQLPDAVKFGIEFAQKSITKDNLKWLSQLQIMSGQIIDNKSVLMVHGSPWNPIKDYLYSDSNKLVNLYNFDFDIICFGQTHRSLYLFDKNKIILNPGSVGQSRDKINYVCAAVLDTISDVVERIEIKYNPNNIIDIAKKNGAGNWIYKHLEESSK